MKIAIDCRMSGMSGIGVYLDNLVEYFLEDNKSDSFLLVGDISKLSKYENVPNCKILHTTISIFSFKEFCGFPTREINKCDVFYTPNFNIPFGIKIPIYSTIHDVVFLDIKGLTSNVGWLIRWLFLWRATRISKMVFTVSEFSRNRICFHFKNCPSIVVANSGINSQLKSFNAYPHSPYSFSYILFIGNIKKHKGLRLLLEAYDKACKIGFNRKLVIVGDYKSFKTADLDIINQIDTFNDHIVFTGKITNEELYNTIAHADLLVQPSFYEGFGLPPLEALYLGCNVLISDIPVFREIYDPLPLTFFDLANVDELSSKIVECSGKKKQMSSIKTYIDTLYSLKRTAQTIMGHFS